MINKRRSAQCNRMDNRPEERSDARMIVRIWGMDAENRPFFQNANAGDISSEGAHIFGINHPLKAGDIIGVQLDDKKARFKVIWVVDRGLPRKVEVGVKVLPGQRAPWFDLATKEKHKIAPGKNKRKFERHKILFPLVIGFEDARRTHLQTNATDIGGRGCYVETLLPLPLATPVSVTFWMDSETICTSGIVRASDPNVGMGIEFTTLDNHFQERLQQYIEKLDPGLTGHENAKGASSGG